MQEACFLVSPVFPMIAREPMGPLAVQVLQGFAQGFLAEDACGVAAQECLEHPEVGSQDILEDDVLDRIVRAVVAVEEPGPHFRGGPGDVLVAQGRLNGFHDALRRDIRGRPPAALGLLYGDKSHGASWGSAGGVAVCCCVALAAAAVVVAAAVAGLYAMICIYIYTMASSPPPGMRIYFIKQ